MMMILGPSLSILPQKKETSHLARFSMCGRLEDFLSGLLNLQYQKEIQRESKNILFKSNNKQHSQFLGEEREGLADNGGERETSSPMHIS